MTTPSQTQHIQHQTAYQLLVASEEKERGVIEDIVYLLLVVATSASIWQFSHQPVNFAGISRADEHKIALLQVSNLRG
jgi:hypothetical protein